MTSNGLLAVDEAPPFPIAPAADAGGLLALLERRRSIRRLRPGQFPEETQHRILEAIRLTPAAHNLPPWHVVLVRDERAAFWRVVADAFRERLDGDRLARYLDRLAGFREGVAVALVYEDVSIRSELAASWQISDEQAQAFAQQGLGMVQLALWLALTAEGLVTSLQHWDWLIEEPLADFLGLPEERFRLVATMPIGHADEEPRPTERIALDRIVSRDRFAGDGRRP